MHKTSVLCSLLVLTISSIALASDSDTARLLTRDGAPVGWTVRYVPPDPYAPPDPYVPPDPYKGHLNLFVDADQRTDLVQQVVFRHHDAEGISPCIRVLHQFLADGSMSETINLLDADDAVMITVPTGYVLHPVPGGYALAPAP